MSEKAAPRRRHSFFKRHLADFLSFSRIVFAPVVYYLIRSFDRHSAPLEYFTIIFTVLLLATDALDGFYARKYATPTVLGAAIDPIADSLFFLTTLFSYLAHKRFTVSPLVGAVIVWREVLMQSLRRWAAWHKVSLGARLSGKAKTMTQCVLVTLMMLLTALSDTKSGPFGKLVTEDQVQNLTRNGWITIAIVNILSLPEYIIYGISLQRQISSESDEN